MKPKHILIVCMALAAGAYQGLGQSVLGTANRLEGPAAGSDSVVLSVNPQNTSWEASPNATWLHLPGAFTSPSESGTGSINVIFTFDANPGATRVGTLTIAGLTLTVTQAGSTYTQAGTLTTLVSSGLSGPEGVAVNAGNVYICDSGHNAIKELPAGATNVTTLVSSGLGDPLGLAVDVFGNVYIGNTEDDALDELPAGDNTLKALIAPGDVVNPAGVAVDRGGNVYIAESDTGVIVELSAGAATATILVASDFANAFGVAVDAAGNVDFSNGGQTQVGKWTAATSNETTLISSGLKDAYGLAVDGAGNLYIADGENIKEFSAVSNNLISLVSSGLTSATGVAVDGLGNVYIADYGASTISELPYAFVDPTPRQEGGAAGQDALPTVLPATESLLPPFAPASDQSWLTITGITNDVVSFAFTLNNTGEPRLGHITLLGQTIPIMQADSPPLATTEPATFLTTTSATLNGFINPEGFGTTVYFVYGPTSSYGSTNEGGIVGSGITALAVSIGVAGLSPGTLYHFEVLASNSVGVTPGGDLTFTTPQAQTPLTLISPTNLEVFTAPAIIPLDAQLSTSLSESDIQSVSFYAVQPTIETEVLITNITSVAGITNFAANWANDTPGAYVLRVVATDTDGDQVVSTSANITVVPVILVNGQYTNTHSFTFLSTHLPVVTMTNPYPGGYVRYTTDGSSPIKGSRYVGPLTIRSSVLIRAETIASNGVPLSEADSVSITIVPIADLPVIGLTSPTNGASFSITNTLVIQATAQPAKEIQQVSFYVDGQLFQTSGPPYRLQIPTEYISPGGHTLQASAVTTNGFAGASPLVYFTINTPGTTLIDFDPLNTSAGAVGGTILSNYLAGYGVRLTNVTDGTVMDAVNTNSVTGNIDVIAPSAPNYFTQAGLDQPVSFTLKFATPLQSFGFTRVGLSAASGLLSHPQWTATAFDTNGVALSSVSEGLILGSGSVPPQLFDLSGNGIASVRFDSDSEQIAAFSAVLLDNLTLGFNPVESLLSVSLSVSPPAPSAPATLTLDASVTNYISGSNEVSFFEGPTLLGIVSNSPYQLVVTNVLAGSYSFQASALDPSGQAAFSAVVPVKVQLASNSALVNFDSLNTSRAPVSGATVNKYLAGFGITVTNLSAGTELTVYNQDQIAGGSAALASSPPNLLTQTGSSGPVQFTLSFAPLLRQFGFTRPELLANPFVSHPAWQATAYDGAGTVVAQVGEAEIDSATNVGAAEFNLSGPGLSIATVQFDSEGTGLTTFNAMLIDDLVLTTNPPGSVQSSFPLSVAITQPVSGLMLAAPPAVTVTANAADRAGVVRVNFYANGALIGTSTNSPYSVTWERPEPGTYSLMAVAMGAQELTATSSAVTVVIQPPAYLFGISGQPVSQTVAAGAAATFSVVATGTNNITYQWSFDGQPIPGATANPLVIGPPVENTNAGTYSVAVASLGVTNFSSNAVLTVVDPPDIISQPAGQTAPAGADVTLSVVASRPGPLTYQWLLNRNSIPGATNSAYSIPAAQPRQSGNYQVVVANPFASTLSAVAPVIVETAVTIPETNVDFASRAAINPLLGPVSDSNQLATVQNGAPLPNGEPGGNSIWFTWTPDFTGTATLTTQGSDFETVMAVYTGTELSKLKVVASDDDSGGFLTSLVTFNVASGTAYQIAVDGYEGASGRVVLGLPTGTGDRVLSALSGDSVPLIVKNPASQQAASGGRVVLSVDASSSTKMGFQWFFQETPIADATAASFVIAHLSDGTVGQYEVLVTNAAGSALSEPATVQITLNEGVSLSPGGRLPASTNVDSPGPMGIVLHLQEVGGGDTAGYSASQTVNLMGAVAEPNQPAPCGQVGGPAEWFTFAARASGQLLASTAGSDFNTILGVYTNLDTNLVSVGCGYTTNYKSDGQPSVVADAFAGVTYYVFVSGYNSEVGVARINIGLGKPLTINASPASRLITAGSNTTFQVEATGSTPISYQWQLNGLDVAGATKSSYTVTKAQNAAMGNYTVIVSNVLGAVTSYPPASLTLQFAPAIVSGPSNLTVTAGEAAKFTVTAIGVDVKTNPFVCQWYLTNGAPVPKADGLVLSFSKTSPTNAGSYYLVISNSYGSVTSAPAVLTVDEKSPPNALSETPARQQVTYSGLFYPANGATEASSGFFSATVDSYPAGVFSARLLLDGGSFSFAGQFDSSGNARSTVERAGQTPVTALLHLNLDPLDDQMTGAISNAAWLSLLQAGRAATNLAPIRAGQFALVIPPGTGAPAGYLAITNSQAGTALVTGTLPDGASLVRAAPMNEGAAIPLYVPLYSGQGVFLGWITFTNAPAASTIGQATWIKPDGTNSTPVLIVK